MLSSLCIVVTLVSTASAFAPSHSVIGSSRRTCSSPSSPSSSSFSSITWSAPCLSYEQRRQRLTKRYDAQEDCEAARAAFEKLWKKDTLGTPVQMKQRYEMLKKRHERELHLLRSLEHSDDAVKDLLSLWSTTIAQPEDSYATGKTTTTTLVRLEPEVLHPATEENVQHHEAQQLRRMAERHPNWAEPCLRLAAYYWRQNDTLAAYEWALKGLENQPYHFVASTLFLLLSVQEGHQAEIKHWARMRLPRSFGKRRTLWVHRAIEECQIRWNKQATEIKQALGVSKSAKPSSSSSSKTTKRTTSSTKSHSPSFFAPPPSYNNDPQPGQRFFSAPSHYEDPHRGYPQYNDGPHQGYPQYNEDPYQGRHQHQDDPYQGHQQHQPLFRPSYSQSPNVPGMTPFRSGSWYSVDTSHWDAPPPPRHQEDYGHHGGGGRFPHPHQNHQHGYSGFQDTGFSSHNNNWNWGGSMNNGPSTPPPQPEWQ